MSRREPEVGDKVEIRLSITSDIDSIDGNVLKLRDGTKLTWNGKMWELLLKEEHIRITEFEPQEVIGVVGALGGVPDKEFRQLCMTNKLYYSICKGNMSEDDKSKYGDLTNTVYYERCKNTLPRYIFEYKPRDITWKELYDRYINFQKIIPDLDNFKINQNINTTELIEIIVNYIPEKLFYLLTLLENGFAIEGQIFNGLAKYIEFDEQDRALLKYILDKGKLKRALPSLMNLVSRNKKFIQLIEDIQQSKE